jgi:hypothetical protein
MKPKQLGHRPKIYKVTRAIPGLPHCHVNGIGETPDAAEEDAERAIQKNIVLMSLSPKQLATDSLAYKVLLRRVIPGACICFGEGRGATKEEAKRNAILDMERNLSRMQQLATLTDALSSTGVTYAWLKDRYGWKRPEARERMMAMGCWYQKNTKRWKHGGKRE